MNNPPYTLLRLSKFRTADMCAAARAHALARQALPRSRPGRWLLHARAGWLLVELGLRLIRPSAAADVAHP